MNTFQEVQASSYPLSPFVAHLVQDEPRFRFYRGVGNETFNDEKYFVVEKNIIHLPAGLPSVEHEIAHAVEMKDQKRWLLPDWGMSVKGFTTDFYSLTPRMMFAGMTREIRVRAIQLHIVNEDSPTSTLKNILNNSVWREWSRTMVPFGRFKNYSDVYNWVGDIHEKTFKQWSQDRIVHEWKIRLNHWQNWMETA